MCLHTKGSYLILACEHAVCVSCFLEMRRIGYNTCHTCSLDVRSSAPPREVWENVTSHHARWSQRQC